VTASRAIRIHKTGGPEELHLETVDVGNPSESEVLVRHTAIGLNFTDIHHRTGRYPGPGFPLTLGMEAAGRIEAVGPNITEFKVGDRVVYGGASPSLSPGAYCDLRLMQPARLVPLPDDIDDDTAAAVFLKGVTAEYLIFGTYAVKAGDTLLVHAAAGGVGLMLCQWAHSLGATVIGTASSDEKAALARANGCTYALVLGRDDVVARVREITNGAGATVVYDSVGASTFELSLASVRKRGLVVSFGSASGPVPPLDLFRLNRMGSLYVTSAGFADYTSNRPELLARADNLFKAVRAGAVKVHINQRYPLEAAQQAHLDLQARKNTGSSLILP
jgi:NADPH2:quinone reductase